LAFLNVNVHTKFFLSRALHWHPHHKFKIGQTALAGVIGSEVPSEHTVVCPIKDFANAEAILHTHDFVVAVNVSDVTSVLVNVLFKVLGGIEQLKLHKLDPVRFEEESLWLGFLAKRGFGLRKLRILDFIKLCGDVRF
jgi:hypothetical protein